MLSNNASEIDNIVKDQYNTIVAKSYYNGKGEEEGLPKIKMNTFYEELLEELEDKKFRMIVVEDGNSELDKKITELFYRLMLPPDEGTAYLRIAVKILCEEQKYYDENSIIYGTAKILGEPVKNVNRCIMNSVEKAWLRMDVSLMTKIFGACKWNKAPSNPEFIAGCVKFIQKE